MDLWGLGDGDAGRSGGITSRAGEGISETGNGGESNGER